MLTTEELEDAVAAVQSRLDAIGAEEQSSYRLIDETADRPGAATALGDGGTATEANSHAAIEASCGGTATEASSHAAIEPSHRTASEPGGAMRGEAFPGSRIALIAPTSQKLELELAHATWGFEVEWSKRPIFNTRIESAIEGSAMWRDAIQTGRCLVPAAAFFEPHATETIRSPKSGRTIKRAYRFADPDGLPLLLAGVRAEDRCSIVTCEPNRWVSPIHPRMPLILRFEEVGTWLEGDWPSLADRASIELAVQPELPQDALPQDGLPRDGLPQAGLSRNTHPQTKARPDQLSLF